jgi:predicted methyltransferase
MTIIETLTRYAVLAACIVWGYPTGYAAALSSHTHEHSFSGADQWAQYFDDPRRDAWQKPHEVMTALGLKPDTRVADIGAGTGYFTVRLAHQVPQGRVYAVDTEPDMLRHLRERATREKLNNVTVVTGAPASPQLPRKVDVVLMVDVYHHIGDRTAYFRKLSESLAAGGRVAIIDYRLDAVEGPPKAARIAPARIKSELADAGYTLAQEHDFLPRQYFLIFAKAARSR